MKARLSKGVEKKCLASGRTNKVPSKALKATGPGVNNRISLKKFYMNK